MQMQMMDIAALRIKEKPVIHARIVLRRNGVHLLSVKLNEYGIQVSLPARIYDDVKVTGLIEAEVKINIALKMSIPDALCR